MDHPDIEWPTGELSCRVEPHGLLSGCVQAGAQGQRAEAVAGLGQLVEFCPSELGGRVNIHDSVELRCHGVVARSRREFAAAEAKVQFAEWCRKVGGRDLTP